MERYLRVNLLRPGPRLMKKRIYRAAVSQRLRNTALEQYTSTTSRSNHCCHKLLYNDKLYLACNMQESKSRHKKQPTAAMQPTSEQNRPINCLT